MYKPQMVHHYWIVVDGSGKVVAEGFKDLHAAREWIGSKMEVCDD